MGSGEVTDETGSWYQYQYLTIDEANLMAEGQETPRVLEVEMGEDMPIPQEGPKYPWDKLAEGPGQKNFVLRGFRSESDAKQTRQNVYAQGYAYYKNKELEFVPKVIVMDLGNGEWVVRAWAKVAEQGE